MPCQSDHMEAHGLEIPLSKVYCLLSEIGGKPIDKGWWAGYHPDAYPGKATKERLDNATRSLCAILENDVDPKDFSLELQTWWRDHQEADRKREKWEKREMAREEIRAGAIAKLTDREMAALGLKR